MGRFIVVENNMFDLHCTVAVGVTDKELFDWVVENTTLDVTAEFVSNIKLDECRIAKTINHEGCLFIRLTDWTASPMDHALLAHEAFHTAEYALSQRGIQYDMDISGEVFAYFIGDVVRQVMEGLQDVD